MGLALVRPSLCGVCVYWLISSSNADCLQLLVAFDPVGDDLEAAIPEIGAVQIDVEAGGQFSGGAQSGRGKQVSYIRG